MELRHLHFKRKSIFLHIDNGLFRPLWNTRNRVAAIILSTFILTSCTHLISFWVKPNTDFDIKNVPPAPDYVLMKNWLSHPDKKDPADITPEGFFDNQKTAKADVFFIHPTLYFGRENWNSPLQENSATEELLRFCVANQASVFNGSCRVYAPHYREATLYSFFDTENNGMEALDLAYSDVLRAFDYYMEHFNNGRPFIIAGHSQGSCHGQRLIMERIDGSELSKRFICGYIIGYPLPMKRFGTSYKTTKPCNKPWETGCIVTWMTHGNGGNVERKALNYYEDGWKIESDETFLCVNPVSWKRDSSSTHLEDHKGGAFVEYDNPLCTVLRDKATGQSIQGFSYAGKELVSAECSEGILYINDPGKPFHNLLRKNNYHRYDISLFYFDIRANVAERVDSYFKTHE